MLCYVQYYCDYQLRERMKQKLDVIVVQETDEFHFIIVHYTVYYIEKKVMSLIKTIDTCTNFDCLLFTNEFVPFVFTHADLRYW